MATTKSAEMPTPAKPVQKIYELIKSGPRVQFFRTLEDGSKIEVENHDEFTPHLVYTFTDSEGNSRTTRFLKAANSIYQDEQIKAGFPANSKIGEADRAEIRFKGSKLVTSKKNVQQFLDNCPANEKFEGDRGEYQVCFREFKPEIVRKKNSDLALRQAKCIIALEGFSEEQMDTRLIRINGSGFGLPPTIEEKKEALLDLINEVDYETLALILEEDQKDSIDIIVGKAINKKVLSFIEAPGQISIKRNGSFVKLLQVSEDHSEEQKIALFIDTLRTEEGKITLTAIEEAMK